MFYTNAQPIIKKVTIVCGNNSAYQSILLLR